VTSKSKKGSQGVIPSRSDIGRSVSMMAMPPLPSARAKCALNSKGGFQAWNSARDRLLVSSLTVARGRYTAQNSISHLLHPPKR